MNDLDSRNPDIVSSLEVIRLISGRMTQKVIDQFSNSCIIDILDFIGVKKNFSLQCGLGLAEGMLFNGETTLFNESRINVEFFASFS